ncbi:MAG: hypothetical protein H6625_03890 [Bdellovibrionaceae bacterium]|nr:hypothetical protein [Pseudobdellovibrionaceae bacterium]
MSKVLVIGRRRHFDRVYKLARKLYPDSEIVLWSDEKLGGKRVQWVGSVFYRKFSEEDYKFSTDGLTDEAINEIIVRCRYLRSLPYELARKMAICAFDSWKEILTDNDYTDVFTLPIDSFQTDTLSRAAKYLNIKALAPVTTPFSGRIRFTLSGEILNCPLVDSIRKDIIEREIQRLSTPTYRADVLMGVNSSPLITILRRLLIDSLKPPFFFLYRILAKDPLSFSFPSRRYCKKTMFATPTRALSAYRMEKKSTLLLPNHYVFIPLQFYPEATTDYWIKELDMINHHKVVLAIIDSVKDLYPVVIKEHPTAIGRRSSSFLNELFKRNVYFAPLLSHTSNLVKEAEVVVGAGTTTILQALIHKKPVLFTGTPFYGSGGGRILKSICDINNIRNEIIKAIENSNYKDEDIYQVVERYYKTSSPGRLGSYKIIGEKSISQSFDVEIPEETKLFFNAVRNLTSYDVV